MTKNIYDSIRDARARFLETGEILPQVRQVVADSWKRCRSYDVTTSYQVEKLSTTACKNLLQSYQDLIETARPILHQLVQLVNPTQYVVTLHNQDGWILDYMFAGDNPVFSARGFDIGTLWSEKTIGTSSAILSIMNDREIQLIGYEHYNERMHDMIGSAAPIHDEQDKIIGCINMCGHYTTGNIHTLGLMKMTASLIEARMRQQRLSRLDAETFDLLPESILILDEQFQVRKATLQAASVLRMSQNTVCSLDFSRLFRKEDFLDRLRRSATPFSYPEYRLALPDGRSISCSVQVTPVLRDQQHGSTVVILRESHVMNRMANRVSGNHASYSFNDIITADASMIAQINMMKSIADTDCCVLIEGESGTGKELFAHSLHHESYRRKNPFIAVNCASLPRNLVESELFGYEKGAFTGARSEGSPGKFELADGGTIFLDEIGELPLEIQASLLRVLDNHKIVRIGGRTEKKLDVRVIAATNRSLYQEVQNGNFRSDLYFRINVLKFDIPPLRTRGKDIALLSETFLTQINEKGDARKKTLSQSFLDAAFRYSWPGNVRELQNTIVRAYYACQGTELTEKDLPVHIRDAVFASSSPAPDVQESFSSFPGILAAAERQIIADALQTCGGNVEQAGAMLGMSKATVYRRMKKYGITLR